MPPCCMVSSSLVLEVVELKEALRIRRTSVAISRKRCVKSQTGNPSTSKALKRTYRPMIAPSRADVMVVCDWVVFQRC